MNKSSQFMNALGKPELRRVHQRAPVIDRKIRVGFVFALALLLILGVVLYQTTLKFREAARWEEQLDTELDKLDEIASELKDAESGERAYLITGDDQYLEPYDEAIQTIDRDLRDLRVLTADNPSLHQKI